MEVSRIYSSTRFSLMTSLLNVMNTSSPEDSSYILSRYFLEHFSTLRQLNIFDVAQECFVSRSGIRRFCQSIGFDNFSMLKDYSQERKMHHDVFTHYADRPDFAAAMKADMIKMMDEIEFLAEKQDIGYLVREIHDSPLVYLLTSDYSSMAAREFQLEMMVMGRLVHLLTDSGKGAGRADSLDSGTLVITCSATGNYALAADETVRSLQAKKVLITKCRFPLFSKTYDRIFYLSETGGEDPPLPDSPRDIYTRYGMNYFLDLLYNRYVKTY